MPRLLLLVLGLAIAALAPAEAAPRDRGDQRFKTTFCRPPLKYAAGACVARCPAGFADTGRVCRFRTMNR
ncbi:hypothetical protein [Methylobacterium gregans]|uniref:Uncharacterized protein n=1 Tax=Methylobacterium gregans TaxID=374424 RepID=A0AA37HQM4_9HYPH|nr:hypothetical protein [Methylobacterium gregans]MDQ0521110.1 hypothetical protein [Methylobacterium gregans]GJD79162.1 hypothetical protein NBEOAGPD_2383 [Methylobacterium gregans]GLS54275.1 hypothetical protein GCM10007886_24580 [Methylobacterium gregans]